MKKIPKQEYTIEFREQAVNQVKMGKSIGLVAKDTPSEYHWTHDRWPRLRKVICSIQI